MKKQKLVKREQTPITRLSLVKEWYGPNMEPLIEIETISETWRFEWDGTYGGYVLNKKEEA